MRRTSGTAPLFCSPSSRGELEIGNTTTQHLIRAISENIPVRWVCGWAGGYNVLVSRKGLNLKPNDAAALKSEMASRKQSGKPLVFGVPTGSMQHAKLAIYLKSIGIDPDKDVQIANIPFPNHPRALEAAEVDLAMTLSAFGAIAIEKGDAALFLHLFGGSFGKQEVGFIVTEKLIKEKPALVQRIVNAHVDAMKTFMGQPDKQIEFERKYSRLPERCHSNAGARISPIQFPNQRRRYQDNGPRVAPAWLGQGGFWPEGGQLHRLVICRQGIGLIPG